LHKVRYLVHGCFVCFLVYSALKKLFDDIDAEKPRVVKVKALACFALIESAEHLVIGAIVTRHCQGLIGYQVEFMVRGVQLFSIVKAGGAKIEVGATSATVADTSNKLE
jgi:hypothetical protein